MLVLSVRMQLRKMPETRISPISFHCFIDVGKDEAETREFLEHLEEHEYMPSQSLLPTLTKLTLPRAKCGIFLRGCQGLDERKNIGVRRENVETWR